MKAAYTWPQLNRLRGRAGLRVEIEENGARAQFMCHEPPRYLEELLAGRRIDEVPRTVSRICAQCSPGHQLTAILALENALGLKVSRQTKLLRELVLHGLMIENHAFQLYYLALPDYFGQDNAFDLKGQYPQEIETAQRLRALGLRLVELAGGRAVHPTTLTLGGFTTVPAGEELTRLSWALQRHLRDVEETVRLFAGVRPPAFVEQPRVMRALRPKGKIYGYLGKTVVSTAGAQETVEAQLNALREAGNAYSTLAPLVQDGQIVATGPLARLNVAAGRLTPRAREALKRSGLKLPSANPFGANQARTVELVYSFERALWVIDQLLRTGPTSERLPVISVRRRRRGVAATELPGGTLYHSYEIDDDGRVTRAKIVAGGAQSVAAIERDLAALAYQERDAGEERLQRDLAMLIRAHDPCLLCAVH